MNFLSHHAVAKAAIPDAPPIFYVGNVLPDLIGTSGVARMRMRHVAEVPRELARGSRLHLATDRRFHSHPAFAEAMEAAAALMRSAPFTTPPHRMFFLAHLFVEISLDALLAREDRRHVDHFYAQFDLCDLSEVAEEACQLLGKMELQPGIAAILHRFVIARYLYHYPDPVEQAKAMTRVCQRAGVAFAVLPEDRETLKTLFDQFSDRLSPRKTELLTPPAAALWYNFTNITT